MEAGKNEGMTLCLIPSKGVQLYWHLDFQPIETRFGILTFKL